MIIFLVLFQLIGPNESWDLGGDYGNRTASIVTLQAQYQATAALQTVLEALMLPVPMIGPRYERQARAQTCPERG